MTKISPFKFNVKHSMRDGEKAEMPLLQPGSRRDDLLAVAALLLYCLLYLSLRLLVSSSMELDESEQFLRGASFSLGAGGQPPLYSWLVHAFSLLSGMSLATILTVKYAVLFLFYGSFYLLARTLWGPRESFLLMGSLMLFPTYAYEFNRDLSHTILVSAMAAITTLVFIRVLMRGNPAAYLCLGLSAGLGVLSKYNFAFFLLALALAGMSTQEGRRAILDRKSFLSAAGFAVAVMPHFFWIADSRLTPVSHALKKAGTGGLGLLSPAGALSMIISAYADVLIFGAVFLSFFAGLLSRGRGGPVSHVLRRLAAFGLVLPLAAIIILKTGQFRGRWLAPVLFPLAPALFSFVDLRKAGRRVKYFAGICVLIALGVLFARGFIGFFPDAAGKVERVHIPFSELSDRLARELAQRGVRDLGKLYVVSDSPHLAANLMAHLPFKGYLILKDLKDSEPDMEAVEAVRGGGGVVIWKERKDRDIPPQFPSLFPRMKPAGTVQAPYLHSRGFPPYVLGVAVIPEAGAPEGP